MEIIILNYYKKICNFSNFKYPLMYLFLLLINYFIFLFYESNIIKSNNRPKTSITLQFFHHSSHSLITSLSRLILINYLEQKYIVYGI